MGIRKEPQNLELVEKLREFGQRHGKSPAEVAIAWTLRHPADFRLLDDEITEVEAAL